MYNQSYSDQSGKIEFQSLGPLENKTQFTQAGFEQAPIICLVYLNNEYKIINKKNGNTLRTVFDTFERIAH